jgi:hypothetical protein
VRFNVAVPEGVEPGGYRTGILFEFAPASLEAAAAKRELSFKSRIATLIYVNNGAPPVLTELVDVKVRPTGEGVDVIATVKNSGRRTVRTKGTLVLIDAAGAVARETAVPDVPLLPESEREVAVPVAIAPATPLAPGQYRAELKLDLGQAAIIVGETSVTIAK